MGHSKYLVNASWINEWNLTTISFSPTVLAEEYQLTWLLVVTFIPANSMLRICCHILLPFLSSPLLPWRTYVHSSSFIFPLLPLEMMFHGIYLLCILNLLPEYSFAFTLLWGDHYALQLSAPILIVRDNSGMQQSYSCWLVSWDLYSSLHMSNHVQNDQGKRPKGF